MLLLLGGCDGNKSRLTDAEVERLAITQKIELVEAAGGFVLMVGGETLTSDEIIETRTQLNGLFVSPKEYFRPIAQTSELEQFKERAKGPLEEILMAKVSNILLYQHAKRQAGGNIDEGLEKAAENEYRKFVLGFGGDQARADDELKLRLMDKKSFIEQQKRSFLIQWYIASKMPNNRPVWRDFGGLWRSVQPSSLAEPYDILAVAAEKIEPGQVAGPIVTKQHIFIMKLQEKQIAGYELFEEVQELVEEKVLLDRRNEVVDKLNSEIRRQAKLSRTDKFVDFCLVKIYRISNTGSEISGSKNGAGQ